MSNCECACHKREVTAYCLSCKFDPAHKPAESVSPAPQPNRRDDDLKAISERLADQPLSYPCILSLLRSLDADHIEENERWKADYVSLREELDKANRNLGAYRQAVQRGEEDYIDADGLLRCFIDEQERLNGVVADMRKALDTRQALIHNAQDHQWNDWRKCDQPWCVEAQKLSEVKP